ncbi:hypothetical protein K437DRAFT_221452, partial [Tilletiaria anomala UBC 951]
ERGSVAVVGLGISGTVEAYTLVAAPNLPLSVVLLEAKKICFGAYGRNGGQIRPDCFAGFNT